MIDKGKYASHGTKITRMSHAARADWNKPKLAVIQPEPTSNPRIKPLQKAEGIEVNSKTFDAKFRFQSNVDRQPVGQALAQPFLYIEKVVKKQTLEKKLASVKSYEPFVPPSANTRSRVGKRNAKGPPPLKTAPEGFKNLYDYEQQRRRMAEKLFSKLFEAGVENLKDLFGVWRGRSKKNDPQLEVSQSEFIDFVKEIMPQRMSDKQLKQFFSLYCVRPVPPPLPPEQKERRGRMEDKQEKKGERQQKQKEDKKSIHPLLQGKISIKALSFNYEKYRKGQLEVSNLLSQKAAKQRYTTLRNYLIDFDKSYPSLKEAMNSIKQYEESLKRHFRSIFVSYQNPFAEEIHQLEYELQQPIVKYDKFKKQSLEEKIQKLKGENQDLHTQLKIDFEAFMESYETAVLLHHDLFFTKRTAQKLLLPIANQHPLLTRSLISQQIEEEQGKKERFLECLSEVVVEIDQDKKHLGEDCFTLEEVVQLVVMGSQKRKLKFDQEFTLYCVKKMIREIKKQFLLKYDLGVESLDEFPATQEIELDLLHTCFEMECTKVLFKNKIWTELLEFIPAETQKSKFHQNTIEANVCQQFMQRYFAKLDQRMGLQRNQSKHISLLAENATLRDFGYIAKVIDGVAAGIDHYVQDEDEEELADQVGSLPIEKTGKKVSFGDLVDRALDGQKLLEEKMRKETPQSQQQTSKEEEARREAQQRQQEALIVKSLIKSIYQESPEKPPKVKKPEAEGLLSMLMRPAQPTMPQQFQETATMAKSFYQPEGMNTNSFDIRYYEKVKEEEIKNRSIEPEVVRMGSSILLSHLPQVEQVKAMTPEDPLGISRMLMSQIDKGIKEEKRVVREREQKDSIKQGVEQHYYKDKIKLQNKPTVFDSQGRSKYSVLMPVGYYEDFVAAENSPDEDKWYLRPHHVETLTENPLSKKDNLIHTEYKSKLDKLPPMKRPDEHLIEANVKRKQELIDALQDRLAGLKRDLITAQRGSRGEGAQVPPAVVNNYLTKLIENKEDKELQMASYEGVLYDLRRKQRELLVGYRQQEDRRSGEPQQKWWQRKDKAFNNELRKDRLLVGEGMRGSSVHRQYVDKLKNHQVY